MSGLAGSEVAAYDVQDVRVAARHQYLDHAGGLGARNAQEGESIAPEQTGFAFANQADGYPLGRHFHRQVLKRRVDFQSARENRIVRVRRVGLQAGCLKNVGRSDGVGEDHPVAVAIKPLELRPAVRQRAVKAAVPPSIAEIGKASVFRVRPAGLIRVDNVDSADDSRVDLVATVEVDPVPVDEPLAGPGSGQTKRVVIIDHPGSPSRNSPRPRIEPDGNSLEGEVRAVIADFKRGRQAWTVIHRGPGLDLHRRGAPARSLGKLSQVGADRREYTGSSCPA